MADQPDGENTVIKVGKSVISIEPGVTPREIVAAIEKNDAQNDKEVEINEVFDCLPTDGALGLMHVLKEIGGVVNMEDTRFMGRPCPPTVVRVATAVDTYTDMVWGALKIPGVVGEFKTSMTVQKSSLPQFCLVGKCRKRDLPKVARVATELRAHVRSNSIYRGKTIRVDLPSVNDFNPGSEESVEFDFNADAPKFIDVSKFKFDGLVYNASTREQILDQLFGFVRHYDEYVRAGLGSNRAVMLAGPYGTGKTLTMSALCAEANRLGWTAIYATNINSIFSVLKLASFLQPALVCVEDIDGMMPILTQMRNGYPIFKRLCEEIDGTDSKHLQRLIVTTSNHIEHLPPALLRPGRFSSIIQFGAFDVDGNEKLMRQSFGSLLADNSDLSQICAGLKGKSPAYVRMLIDDVKARFIRRSLAAKELGLQVSDKITDTDIQAVIAQRVDDQVLSSDRFNPGSGGLPSNLAKLLADLVNGSFAIQIRGGKIDDIEDEPPDSTE